jgi:hypothetical protein
MIKMMLPENLFLPCLQCKTNKRSTFIQAGRHAELNMHIGSSAHGHDRISNYQKSTISGVAYQNMFQVEYTCCLADDLCPAFGKPGTQ